MADENTLDLITRFETILDTSDFSNENYDKQLEAIRNYYRFTCEIPAFVMLVLILYNCGYFKLDFSIHIFLEMVLEGDSNKIADFTKTYAYYSSVCKFIPLFSINLGMGYAFVIGWDVEFDGMIGLTENGSDGNEVIYNIQRAMKYFSEISSLARLARLAKLEKIDKKQLQEDYLKMLGMTDIYTSSRLDYSRRLDICDMIY